MCSEKVAKVTKTQFVTSSGRRYKKDRGAEIGESFSFAGIIVEDFGIKLCIDETVDYNNFCKKIKLELYIGKNIEKLHINFNSKHSIEELKILNEKVKELALKLKIED